MSEPETGGAAEGLFREGAAWFARMRGPEAEESRTAFDEWLGRSAAHRAAFNRASEIFAMGKVLAEDRDEAGAPRNAGLARSRRHTPVLAAIGVAVLATGSFVALHKAPMAGSSGPQAAVQVAEFAAAPGAPRDLRLIDGSLVHLSGGTQLGISFSTGLRRLDLHSGIARFKVAHEARPFVVYAGGGSVTAHGTIFDISLLKSREVSVRLIEGVVDVSLPPSRRSAPPQRERLHPGETISFASAVDERAGAARVDVPAPPAPEGVPEQGTLDYDQIRVSDLVARANGKASRPIRLAEPQLGDQNISGRFRVDDSNVLADRLAALLDLRVDRSDPKEIVLRRR